MKKQTVITTIVIVAIGMTVFWLSQQNIIIQSSLLRKIEGWLIDQRYLQRTPKPPDPSIVLVGVETSSLSLSGVLAEEIAKSPTLQLMKEPFPWDRRVWAATLEKLRAAGAKVVVFDFLFTSPSTREGDEAFASAIFNHLDHVVLASTFDYQIETDLNDLRVHQADQRTYRTYTPPASTLVPEGSDDVIGFATVWDEGDGVIRRGKYRTSREREDPLLKEFADRYPDNLLHLSARAVQKFTGSVDTPPYDKNNFIDFQGSKGTYKPIPIESLFSESMWNSPPIDGASNFFKNKIVVVGPIANYFHDVKGTPLEEMPGPELQCQMIATLLSKSSLEETSGTYNRIVTFVMVVIALAICLLVTHAVAKGLLMIVMIAGFFGVCQYAFSNGNLVVRMTPPLFGFTTTGLSVLVLQFFQEQAERRRVRKVLDRYVSKNVADLVLDDPNFVDSLRGQKKMVTILFSDIRGFTGMTEGRDPEQLVAHLNEYFSEMVGVVLDEKGTLQKFIGDAIMAAWGDALTQGPQEDARHAVQTALRMRSGLQRLNGIWKNQPNRTPLHIGIGVNYGEVIVGNIGTHIRTEFTVLGDVVNFAARLETATKQFHCDILVGESVEELTREHFVFRKVGLITVKGKVKPVETYAVLSDSSKPPPEWLKLYHDGIEQFRRREFERAIETFKIVLQQTGGLDFLCEMYIEWSTRYHRSPPPVNWAGNFILKEK